jgi:hypothetical protein
MTEHQAAIEDITAVGLCVPEQDIIIKNLYEQATTALRYAEGRVIQSNDDLKPATEDLASIANLKKALTEQKKRYLDPLNDKVKAFRAAFDKFFEPIEQADKVTRQKILTFKSEQERKAREAEELNRQAIELARKQAALNGGEFTVDTTPVLVPKTAPDKINTEVGTAGISQIWKFEVIDFDLLSNEYKMADEVKIGKVVRATKGSVAIRGVKIWAEEILRVTARS